MSNFKKLVQVRMGQTGETWQTASRNVRARKSEAAGPASGETPKRKGGGMRPLYRVSNPDFLSPVADLGITEAYVTSKDPGTSEIDGIVLIVDVSAPKTRVAEIARRALAAYEPEPGDVISIIAWVEEGGRQVGREIWDSGLAERLRQTGSSLARTWRVSPADVAGL